ncbi:alpha-galactosidase [Sphingobacterium sp. Mn56C]|uniref:alpha-galactosidase n=1 Tax=Sphingobacterium sp. Mn56C TaxID=3395261 RepID=UPI003BED842D
MNRTKLSITLLLVLGGISLSQAQKKTMSNKHLVLEYNSQSGSYSISKNKDVFVKDAISYVALADGSTVSSAEIIGKRLTAEKAINDALGKGKQYTFTGKTKNGKEIKQHFYLYDNQDFVLVQVEVNGKALSSNKMVPLQAKNQTGQLGSALHQIAMPWDNDTFISYENESLSTSNKVSAEVGVVYDKHSNRGLILGSLDQSTWKSGIHIQGDAKSYNFLEAQAGFVDVTITRDSMGHGFVKGDQLKSPLFFVGLQNDWRKGMDVFAKTHNTLFPAYLKKWDKGTPIGWNSWGVIQEKLSFENATGTADYFAKQIPHFRNQQGDAYIDLDSFWDNMVPGGMSGDYTKLKEFVKYCKDLGLKPGAYWAPFTDWGHGSGPNRKAEGSNYTFGEMWTKTAKGYHDLDGGRALDPTHPGTQKRMDYILGKLKECGFEMIKIDFLSHAAIESTGFSDPKVTTGMQAYSVGMKHLVDVLDGQMLIYAAISPSLATAPFAHMRRIACDAWHTIDQTQYTLNSVSYGWWQTHIYEFIDADHLVFTGEGPEVNKARLLSGLVTGTIILGDDFSKKEGWQQQINVYLQDKELLNVVNDGRSFIPVGFASGKAANDTYVKKVGNSVYIAAFNFKNEATNLSLNLKDFSLEGNKTYQAKELFTKEQVNLQPTGTVHFKEAGAKLFRIDL